MNNKTKKKISKGLKRYHNGRKAKRDLKRLLWFILIVGIVSQFTPYKLQAPEARQWGLPQAEEREMSVVEQIRQIARQEGRSEWADYLVKLSYCESRHKPLATNNKGNYPVYSIDRGLFMYNDYWQSQVSDDCAFDVECSTKQTIKMIEAGKQHRWVCDKYVRGVPIDVVMR